MIFSSMLLNERLAQTLCTGKKRISYSSRKYLNIINFNEYTEKRRTIICFYLVLGDMYVCISLCMHVCISLYPYMYIIYRSYIFYGLEQSGLVEAAPACGVGLSGLQCPFPPKTFHDSV